MSKTREWVVGSLIRQRMRGYKDSFCVLILDNVFTSNRIVAIDKETIGQFTGLQDRNGRDIYEGDIVEHPYIDPIFGDLVEMKDGKGVKSVVVFHEGAFCVRYGEDVFYYLDQFTRHKHIEVVGNIHDNPELMKGGQK